MKSVAIRPAYTPLTQQRMCCVPCALQWILLRRKLPIFTQEEIGKVLRLTVPPKYKRLFGKGIRTSLKEPRHGWGSKTEEARLFNNFLKRHKVPLHVTYVKYSTLKEPEALIARNIRKGNDVMIITFMGAVDKRKRFGHALVVSKITRAKITTITVGDPNFAARKFYDVPLEKLLRGMSKRVGKVERGLYIFSKTRV